MRAGGLSVCRSVCLSASQTFCLPDGWLVGRYVRVYTYVWSCVYTSRQTDRLHSCMYTFTERKKERKKRKERKKTRKEIMAILLISPVSVATHIDFPLVYIHIHTYIIHTYIIHTYIIHTCTLFVSLPVWLSVRLYDCMSISSCVLSFCLFPFLRTCFLACLPFCLSVVWQLGG